MRICVVAALMTAGLIACEKADPIADPQELQDGGWNEPADMGPLDDASYDLVDAGSQPDTADGNPVQDDHEPDGGAGGARVVIEPTGQTKCYDNTKRVTCPPLPCANRDFCGQDAQYATGKRRFSVQTIGDENLVTDLVTGSVWSQTISPAAPWAEAVERCETLEYGGHKDWRIGDYHEMASLFHYGRSDPATFVKAFPDTSGPFWSASEVKYETVAWDYQFNLGKIDSHTKKGAKRGRCVRGPSRYPNPPHRFAPEGNEEDDPTFSDSVTGLVWQGGNQGTSTWQGALAHCEGLTWAGQADWRLPNVNELRSLINIEVIGPASDFPDADYNWFWTSTTDAGKPGNGWMVSFHDGSVHSEPKANPRSVRCVRTPNSAQP